MSQSVRFTNCIQPALLFTGSLRAGTRLVTVGWGRFSPTSNRQPRFLKEVFGLNLAGLDYYSYYFALSILLGPNEHSRT